MSSVQSSLDSIRGVFSRMRLSLPLLYEQDFHDNSLRRVHLLLRKAAMSRTTFKHIPLTRPAEQIRLLKLQPDADDIQLNIQTYELAECPEFVALSYEWGDGSEIHNIIINGSVFKIRQNLHDALKHIRTLQADRSSTRLFNHDSPSFWIDAIAIDQANDREKPHQVSIMGKIYRQASHVVAWLGLEQDGDNSALAMGFLNETGVKLHLCHKWLLKIVPFSAEGVAIRRLCNRPYFQRVWVVQECVLAKKLHLVLGTHYCSWRQLYDFNETLEYEHMSTPISRLFSVKLQFERNWNGESIQGTMQNLLHLTIDKHCSRFHDRIYGLLGILQQSYQTTGMEVDYGASLEELMIKTHEFVVSDPREEWGGPQLIHSLGSIFKECASIQVRGNVAWYWHMNEIMYKLDADVIKGFHSLETLHSEEERMLTFQTICWIAGGHGVELFSSIEESSSLHNATTKQTVSLESLEADECIKGSHRTFVMHSWYTTGNRTYHICLRHTPKKPNSLPGQYTMTESNSWGCRSLLETYSKHVRFLGALRENFKVSTEVSNLETSTQLPIQVEWMVFSNLLAQYCLSRYSKRYRPDHKINTDGFVRQIEREGKDLGSFLSESLFKKYRMSVVDTESLLRYGSVDAGAPYEWPANVLRLVEIEITNSDDVDRSSDIGKKILVAFLYDNDGKCER